MQQSSYVRQAVIPTLCVAVLALVLAICSHKEPDISTSVRLKVVAIFNTAVEEPWDGAIHKALERAEKEGLISYEHTDEVKAADFERVLRGYATHGYDIIVGDAFAAEEAVRRVAQDNPAVAFAFGSGLGPAAPNLSVFDNWIHEPAYLAGLIAGRLTKSGKIGVVGGFPIPEVNRLINAFEYGARETNAEVQVGVTFINSWYDPPKARAATLAFLAQGFDVMYAERAGVIEACAEQGTPVFGNMLDQFDLGPDVVVSSVLWDMWPTVEQLIKRVSTKTFVAEDYAEWSMMAKGGARLASIRESWSAKLDPEIKALLERRTDEIVSGRFRVPVNEAPPRSR